MSLVPHLTIILPSYNPVSNWINTIRNSFDDVSSLGLIEFIIVNDGSNKNFDHDELQSYLTSNSSIHFINYTVNRGKGYALREGVSQAKGKFIIYTDIDFPYTHKSLIEIYSALKDERADIAIGVRGEEYYTHLSKSRVRISKLLRWFIKIFLRIPTDDTQCGLKGMNQKGKAVFLQTTIDRYLFDLEFIFLCARKKLTIKTVEVELRPEIVLSRMNWTILLQEFGNFLKIFAKSVFTANQ